ncbi:hypothetical protein [Chitinophaga sp.]|uniref:hypothetical protein n=1 Tax=Chitinophaga sp. TaxID=1869181 RepID=UPI0031DFB266
MKIIQLSANGYPDIYTYKAGRTIWFECKRPGEESDPLQVVRQQELRAVGMEAYEVDNLDKVKSICLNY